MYKKSTPKRNLFSAHDCCYLPNIHCPMRIFIGNELIIKAATSLWKNFNNRAIVFHTCDNKSFSWNWILTGQTLSFSLMCSFKRNVLRVMKSVFLQKSHIKQEKTQHQLMTIIFHVLIKFTKQQEGKKTN